MSHARPFRLFGPEHIATLLLIAGASCLLVYLTGSGTERRKKAIAGILAAALVAYAAVTYLQKGLAGELSWDYALPLELCHWVLAACLAALLCQSRLAAEIAFFWGSAGTLASALTPDISDGFPSWEFVLFYWSHGAILLAIVFLIARGFRPARGSVARMMLALNLYAALVGALDWYFGWNYGYLCAKPGHPSLLDFMGPWPWYLVSLEIVALTSFWLLAFAGRRIPKS